MRFCRRDSDAESGGLAAGVWDGSVGGGSSGSGWGGGVDEEGRAVEFVSGGWEGEGVCNELGGGRSGRGRLDVGTNLRKV